jgi:serine kinase of HPr protein (carbohydrate metabolism regulator)
MPPRYFQSNRFDSETKLFDQNNLSLFGQRDNIDPVIAFQDIKRPFLVISGELITVLPDGEDTIGPNNC